MPRRLAGPDAASARVVHACGHSWWRGALIACSQRGLLCCAPLKWSLKEARRARRCARCRPWPHAAWRPWPCPALLARAGRAGEAPGAQVRLMLVLAPAACCLAGVALHQLLLTLARSVNAAPARGPAEAPSPARDAAPRKPSKLGKVRRLTLGSALFSPRACVRGGVRVALWRLLATHRPDHRVPDAPLIASHTSITAGSTRGCPPWRLRIPILGQPISRAAGVAGAAACCGMISRPWSMPQAAARAVDKVTAAAARAWHPVPREVAIAALAGAAIVFAGYTVHSVWVRARRSSPPLRRPQPSGASFGAAQPPNVTYVQRRLLIHGSALQPAWCGQHVPARRSSASMCQLAAALSACAGDPLLPHPLTCAPRPSRARAQVSAEMYSAPSIVLQSRSPDGGVHVFDDFREAYAWLRYNTPADSKVASWCAPRRRARPRPRPHAARPRLRRCGRPPLASVAMRAWLRFKATGQQQRALLPQRPPALFPVCRSCAHRGAQARAIGPLEWFPGSYPCTRLHHCTGSRRCAGSLRCTCVAEGQSAGAFCKDKLLR